MDGTMKPSLTWRKADPEGPGRSVLKAMSSGDGKKESSDAQWTRAQHQNDVEKPTKETGPYDYDASLRTEGIASYKLLTSDNDGSGCLI